MKPTLFAILLLTIPTFGLGQSFHENKPQYEHMVEVNAQWKHINSESFNKPIFFDSEEDRIKSHLLSVIEILKSRNHNISKSAKKNRLFLLNELEVYANNKEFPQNIYHDNKVPYFVDHRNVHCAVGYLMKCTKDTLLIAKIVKEHNYDFIENIKTEGIDDWAHRNGFTVDELKWIQPWYDFEPRVKRIEDGVNGTIYKLALSEHSDRVYFGGRFDSIGEIPCLNVGYYENGSLHCFDDGIEGIVKDVEIDTYDERIYLAGKFTFGDTIYHTARKSANGNNWIYDSIPERSDYWGYNYYINKTYNNRYLYITNGKYSEMWGYSASSSPNWSRMIRVNGIIYSSYFESTNEYYYYGAFDSIFTCNSNGTIADTILYHNLIIFNPDSSANYSIPGPLPDTIKTIFKIGPNLLLGGTCSGNPASSKVALVKHAYGQTIPLIEQIEGDTLKTSINDMHYFENSKIIVGGDFRSFSSPPNWIHSKDLAIYYPAFDHFEFLGPLKGEVHSIADKNYIFLFGGNFPSLSENDFAFNIGKLNTELLTIIEDELDDTRIFPNPFNDYVKLNETFNKYEIRDINGRIVKQGSVLSNSINNLSELKAGVYFFHIHTNSKIKVIRAIKN